MLLSSNQQNTVTIVTKIDNIHNKNFQWVSNIVKQMMNLNLEEDFTDVRAFNWKDFLHYPNTVVLKKMLNHTSGRKYKNSDG